MTRLAVFASGNGGNFEAIASACHKEQIQAECSLLICDQPSAGVIERAQNLNIHYVVIEPKDYDTKADYESAILAQLEAYKIDWIALAGYMRLVGSQLLTAYKHRIVNIHPSLLPAFPGLRAIDQALEAGVKVTGVTVHFVDEGMDTGSIIAQEPVTIAEGDDAETLADKVHQLEHRLYPKTLAKLIN
ncbi:phosphoribosylglycinamide formyltransferase [Tuberibacillus sp. Marseille-P3662]|uniref:phosphoribosylglycinamide formyltransferase n=1 Tax=Tuberibacillus sp. Marseille-P3662 TaxID=1965358 RepID=UPI000A1C929B|nr:phosphoribosylglycinamide formyltransferase [Tuberibacillus sp. Marseille-P3662]